MVRYLAVFTVLFSFCFNAFAVDSIPAVLVAGEVKGSCKIGSTELGDNLTGSACESAIASAGNYEVYVYGTAGVDLLPSGKIYYRYATSSFGWQVGDFYNTNTSEEVYICSDDNYPTLNINNCEIAVCSDGFYLDAVLLTCDRATPELPESCSFGSINTAVKPNLPSCVLSDIPPLDENNCAPMTGVDFSTTVCIVNPEDACSTSGVCVAGCGYVDNGSGETQFLCFGDNPNDYEKPDFGFDENTNYDPSVPDSCRKINGTSYCPQDENDYIKPDGTYPSGCGYVDSQFYCVTSSIFEPPLITNTDFTGVSGSDATLQTGFNGISNNLGELGKSVSKNLNIVGQEIKNASILDEYLSEKREQKNADKLDEVKGAIEALEVGGSSGDYTAPVSSASTAFDGVLDADYLAQVDADILTAKGELQTIMNDVGNLFSTSGLTVSDSGYVANVQEMYGVNVDLGAKHLENFSSNFGIQHIIWFVVLLSGIGIMFGVRL